MKDDRDQRVQSCLVPPLQTESEQPVLHRGASFKAGFQPARRKNWQNKKITI